MATALTFQCDDKTADKLKKKAAKEKTSVSEILRQATKAHLAPAKKNGQ